jgi:hypothetical protein
MTSDPTTPPVPEPAQPAIPAPPPNWASEPAQGPLFTDPITASYEATIDGKEVRVNISTGSEQTLYPLVFDKPTLQEVAERPYERMKAAAARVAALDPKGQAGAAKPPLALLPPEALRQAAQAHKLGAEKYGPYNWRENKVEATTYISAMMRHIGQYLDGEDADAESGLSHLAHVIASANILIDAKHYGTLVDNRPPRPMERHPLYPD